MDPTTNKNTALTTSSTSKHNFTWTRHKSNTSSFGIWTKFVEFLGVNIGLETSHSTHDIFRFERMSTEEFFPDEGFLTSTLLSHPAVNRRLKQWRPVYIIVGVKTVSGAQIKRVWARSAGVQAEVAVDAAVLAGAPVPAVTVGPTGGVAVEKGEGMGFEGGDDFVFAYRVLKVRLRRRRREVMAEDYVRGAILGMGMEEDITREVGMGHGMGGRMMGREMIFGSWGEAVEEDIEIEQLEDHGVGGVWKASRAVDGDEGHEVEVFVPK
jgi:hypothetical protein